MVQRASPRGRLSDAEMSDDTAILALQGPQAKDVLTAVLGEGAHVGRFRWSLLDGAALGISGYIRDRYTGEAGYEILVPNADAAPLWRARSRPAPHRWVLVLATRSASRRIPPLRRRLPLAVLGHNRSRGLPCP